jgi:3-hydroxybutyryl-CoA dehydrogenase
MPDIDATPVTHPYLEALIADGHLGMATGKGFYDWTPEAAQAVRDRLSQFLANQSEDNS